MIIEEISLRTKQTATKEHHMKPNQLWMLVFIRHVFLGKGQYLQALFLLLTSFIFSSIK